MAGGAVMERRLQPLWEAIDSRQWKMALKLATNLQKKHPDAPYILALKALITEKMGKPEEALLLCRQAKDMQPVDENTLNTLQMVYQRLGFFEEATQLFENACSKCPGNLELLGALFGSYVREYNYVKQQQTAMKIYKLSGDSKYLIWAVCSIYLQVRPPNVEKKLLTLAEGLLKKLIDSKSIDSEALGVYISLLRDQDKHADALAVVTGELGSLFNNPIDRLRLRGEILMHLHKYSEAFATYKEILEISSDDWMAITELINASLRTSNSGDNLSSLSISTEQKKDRLEQVTNFIYSLQQRSSKELIRGPFLADLEINYRYGSKPMVLATNVLNYFKRFGHLSSFYQDVKVYLSILDKTSQDWLVNELREALSPIEDVNALRRQISAYQVEEHFDYCGCAGGEIVLKMVNLYKESLKYSMELDPEESIIGEELLVMAANLLVKLFLQTNQFSYIVEVLFILEYGLSLRRYNSQFKIMLVSLYSSIGCINLAADRFKILDVKNILFEVASHHILSSLLESSNWAVLEHVLSESIRFHKDYQNEAADMVILAYRHGNYTKIFEFVDLKVKLGNSHHYALSRIEMGIFSLKQKADNLDAIEDILVQMEDGKEFLKWRDESILSSLTFNEDLETRPWWSPLPDVNFVTGSPLRNDMDPKENQKGWRANVKQRSSIPRLLFLALHSVSSTKEENGREELKELLESYLKGFNLCLNDLVSPSLKTEEFPALVFWLALQLSSDNTTDSVAIFCKAFSAAVKQLVERSTSDGPKLGIVTASLVKFLTEPVSWLLICIQGWLKHLQAVVKRKRKPVDEKNATKILEGIRTLAGCVSDELEGLKTWISTQTGEQQEEKIMSQVRNASCGVLNILEGGCIFAGGEKWNGEDLVKSVVNSQRSMLTSLGDICAVRLRVLKTLKL